MSKRGTLCEKCKRCAAEPASLQEGQQPICRQCRLELREKSAPPAQGLTQEKVLGTEKQRLDE